MKRFMACIIVVLLSILFSVYASAGECTSVYEEEEMSLASEFACDSLIGLLYTNIGTISANLSISGDTANCSGRVQSATSGATTSVSVRLQRSTNGVSWSTINTWSGAGTYSADASGQYTFSS